jgi:hypothetical protein
MIGNLPKPIAIYIAAENGRSIMTPSVHQVLRE